MTASGGGTSCDQAAGADAQTASDRKKQIRVFMEGGLNQMCLRRKINFGLGAACVAPRIGHKVDFGPLFG